jgi:hypothetical protein
LNTLGFCFHLPGCDCVAPGWWSRGAGHRPARLSWTSWWKSPLEERGPGSGDGRCRCCRGQSGRHPGEASAGTAAKAREAVAAETDVARPSSASTATTFEIAAPEGVTLSSTAVNPTRSTRGRRQPNDLRQDGISRSPMFAPAAGKPAGGESYPR